MKKKITAFLMCLCMLLLCACQPVSLNLSSTGDPSEDIIKFFDCLSRSDYDAAMDYVGNYSDLGLERINGSDTEKQIYDFLTASRHVEILGSSVTGSSASVSISYTTLDFRKLDSALSARVKNEIKQRQYSSGMVFDSEEAIVPVINKVLEDMITEPNDYYTTEQIDVAMQFDDGKWKIYFDDRLYSALIGYAV